MSVESLFYQYTFENVDIETLLIFPNAPRTWHVLLGTVLIISCGYRCCKNKQNGGFPGELVVDNLPANAGDRVSMPGLGRSHVPQSSWACVPRLLGLCSRASEPQLLNLRAATTEAQAPWRPCSATREATDIRSPATATAVETQHSQR